MKERDSFKKSEEPCDCCGSAKEKRNVFSESAASAPVEVGEPYEGIPPLQKIVFSGGSQVSWSGYEPECALEPSGACPPVQRENIAPPEVYRGIRGGTNRWLDMACQEALRSVRTGGGPFGAVLVQIDDDTKHVLRYWKNHNHVTEWKDPTAHAEISVIRQACRDLGVFHLSRLSRKEVLLPQTGARSHCEIYSSAEPCPMCYAAICWARIPVLVFGATRFDAAAEGVDFSDAAIYEELALAYEDRRSFREIRQGSSPYSLDAFNYWKRSEKIEY